MFRLKLKSIPPRQLGSILIAINILGTFARQCGNDEYFDPNTQNCDSCHAVCAVGDCSRECPNYRMPTSSISTTAANATTTTAATTTATTTVLFGLSLGIIILVIIAAIGFLTAVASFAIIAYKKCLRRNKDVFKQKVTMVPIEETEQGTNSEIVPLNIVVDV
ncbi:hypothetical protein CHS0354_020335 [Potamilus streckersoni]|uniref:Uncharacterized protein n=1 Tax=Potamilus streckersoni TaxID=2493646 RepID=A0AAE0SFV7_9BIVA|nr:hypothetical protein CHS0354_020335 [Potamilus streckersoni]